MLVLPKHNLLIVTPPKTAGKSLRKLFCGNAAFEAHEVVGPVAGERTSSHTATVPDDYGAMRRAVVVRQPLDRIVSTWHHLNEWWAFHGQPSPDFEEYVCKLAAGHYRQSVFGLTINELLGKTRIDEVIHYEQLETDLRRLGLDFEGALPHEDGSYRRHYLEYYSPDTESLARGWAKVDLRRFGYQENGLASDVVKATYLEPKNPRLAHRRKLLEMLPRGAVGAEIGVFCGDFSREILEYAKPKKLYLIDQWTAKHRMELNGKIRDGLQALSDVRRRLAKPIESGHVEIRQGDSLSTLSEFSDGTFDWVYLDTSHFYYDTFAELCLCAKKVKPDGFICGHDYCEIFEHGVVRAVGLFCEQFGYEMVYLTAEDKVPAFHRYGLNATVPPEVSYDSFAIRKIAPKEMATSP